MLTRPSDNHDVSPAPAVRPGDSPAAADPAGADPGAVRRPIDSGGVLGNILFLGSGETVARVIAFVGTSYLARILEPAGFGIIGFATAIYAYLALTVAFVDDLEAREVALRRHAAGVIAYAGRLVTGASLPRRILRSVPALALPLLLLSRIARRTVKEKRHRRELLLTSPLMIIFTGAWAIGEMVGGVLGPGQSLREVE